MSDTVNPDNDFVTADSFNRLDIHAKAVELPVYANIGLGVRQKLRSSVIESTWPPLPQDFSTVDHFFSDAKIAVEQRWNERVGNDVMQLLQSWKPQLSAYPECAEAVRLLDNPSELSARIFVQQLRPLESIRTHAPELWRTLLHISSERQLAFAALLREWVKLLTCDDVKRQEFENHTGISHAELSLIVDAGCMIGKYVDTAYVKQNELADAPGGSDQTPLEGKEGAQFLYSHINNSGETVIQTYAQTFPAEWPRIVRNLRALADRTERSVKSGELPASYAPLFPFLRNMADAFESSSTDPTKLHQLFSLQLETEMKKLIESGCPLFITPLFDIAVAKDANLADMEIRLAFRPPEIRAYEEDAERLRGIGQKWLETHQNAFSSHYDMPRQYLTLQPFAFGSNLFFLTRGDERQAILSHIDAIGDTARKTELPRLRDILTDGNTLDERAYVEASRYDSVCHEFGHWFAQRLTDEKVRRRIGIGTEASPKLEEVKADTCGMKLVGGAFREGLWNEERVKMQLLAKIGDALNYLAMTGASGKRYYASGILILHTLLKNEILKEEEDGRYTLTDPARGIELLGDVADQVLNNYYLNDESNAATVGAFIAETEQLVNISPMQRLLKKAFR